MRVFNRQERNLLKKIAAFYNCKVVFDDSVAGGRIYRKTITIGNAYCFRRLLSVFFHELAHGINFQTGKYPLYHKHYGALSDYFDSFDRFIHYALQAEILAIYGIDLPLYEAQVRRKIYAQFPHMGNGQLEALVAQQMKNVLPVHNPIDIEEPGPSDEINDLRIMTAKEDPTITLGEEYDSKDIYLVKRNRDSHEESYFIGLHAVGHAGPYVYDKIDLDDSVTRCVSNFMSLDTWGNEYDSDLKIVGRGSFRLHTSDIEEYATELESDGWVRVDKPKEKV